MEFRVPQYVDVEDRLFGPFTLNQAIFLAGGIGLAFLLYKTLPFYIAIFLIIPVGYLTWALAFYPKRRYGKSFASLMESAFKFYAHPRLYTWKRAVRKVELGRDLTMASRPAATPDLSIPAIREGKLSSMAWDINVKGNDAPEEIKTGMGDIELPKKEATPAPAPAPEQKKPS